MSGVGVSEDHQRGQGCIVVSPRGEHREVGLAGNGEAKVVMAREDRELCDVAAPPVDPGTEKDLRGTLTRPREPERTEFGWTDLNSEDDFAFVPWRSASHEQVKGLTGLGGRGPFDLKPTGIQRGVGKVGFGQAWKVVG
jgi:hypothetical protein